MESFDKYQNTSFFVKLPCYAAVSLFLTITNRVWFLVYLYVLAQTLAAVQVFRLTQLQALIPKFY